jgi:predicted secreted protein
MSLTLGLAIYFIVWWVTLFAVLPFGVRTQGEVGDVVPGTPESAPSNFRLGPIVLATTIVATAIFALIWLEFRTRVLTRALGL